MSQGPIRWNLLAALLAGSFLVAWTGAYWGSRGGGAAAEWLGAAGVAMVLLWCTFVGMVRRAAARGERFHEMGKAWGGATLLEGIGAGAAGLGLVQLVWGIWGGDAAGGAAVLAAGLGGLLGASLVLDRGVSAWVPNLVGLVGVPLVTFRYTMWPLGAAFLAVLGFRGLFVTIDDPAFPGNEPLEGGDDDGPGSEGGPTEPA